MQGLGSRTATRNLSTSGERNDGNAMMSDEIRSEVRRIVPPLSGACLVTRTASAYAFASRRRAMVASDMLGQLGSAMEMLFDTQGGGQPGGQLGTLMQAHTTAPAPGNGGMGVGGGGGGS
ncbi:hypothetical protein TSOC_005927 [Tetrabaena socialis]|uniref:Uncharacterized protein n=1 Tax=Tetrabaena socialis TaxID=47790 RepID=A0A2J8A4Z7_9CHLO|nr:hypothetical protein TSOC_005927 [Tetrabaena socialis]|eukprot:PNH07586.1 hypothetical protein TSOC_005927 [Tetrabaena socialis]